MDDPASDHDLMVRLADGDDSALATLYDRHAGVVFGAVVRIVADRPAAEDVLQEAFVRAWRHADGYRADRGHPRAWLLGIAHHLALNELWRRRRRPQAVDAAGTDSDAALLAVAAPEPGPAEAAWSTVRRLELVQAMELLPDEQRAVLELYAAGYSQSEIAERLGQPLGSVKTRMRRGLQRLRAILDQRGLRGSA